MLQSFVHYSLHFILPLLVAWLFYKNHLWKTYAVFLLTMLIDLDHLLATPVFNPCRCSINFHPMHSYWAIAVYFILLFPKQTRVIAIGLLMHIAADAIDCVMMNC